MSLPPIGYLGNQLHAIRSLKTGDLISNYSGNALYSKKSWIGRFWSWFYQIHEYYFGPGLQRKNLKSAITSIDQLYKKHLDRVRQYFDLYQNHLNKQKVILLELDIARKELFEFYEATKDYCKPRLLSLIKVESLTKAPFPVIPLMRISRDLSITIDEEKELKTWRVPARWLHEALSLIDVSLGKTERKLADLNPNLFKEPENEHIAWRDSLKPGDSVWCNGRTLKLGKRLGEQKENLDHHVYFEIEGEEEKLLYIGIHRASPEMRKETPSWGAEPASILEVDIEGKCALVERLTTPLSSSNEAQFKTLINWFLWLKGEGCIPDKFKTKFFMFDKEGTLRSTREMERASYSLEAIVKFVDELTSHDNSAFQQIVNQLR